jgi:two-component system, sensor histidine kinase YesM
MMNLRKKVYLAFIVFIIAPLFIVGAITYFLMQNIIEDNFADQTELTINAVVSNISSVFKEANTYSEYWRFETDLNKLYALPNYVWRSPDTKEKENAEEIIMNTLLTFGPVNHAIIYNLSGDSFSNQKGKPTSLNNYPFNDLINHPIFTEMIIQNGTPTWFGPYEYPELTNNETLYTTFRLIREPDFMNVKGYLLEQMDLSELDHIFRAFLYNQPPESRFMIVNHDGLILHDSGYQLNGTNMYKYITDELDLASEYHTQKMSFRNTESMLSVYKFNLEHEGIKNWSLVYVTPWDNISGKTLGVMKNVALITVSCLIFALLFNLLFVNRYIRFILKLVSSMKQVELGNLNVRVPVTGKDETTVMARGFNNLVERITSLLEEVKMEQQHKNKAELMLLEAQIKPHFLFNTLESINGLAIQNEGKKVSQLIYRLGSMLRMFEHKEEITLSLELDYLRNYLEIQSFRFENLFKYKIDVPASLNSYFILKLTLQPLVENSIHHGFEGYEVGGIISIRAEEHAEHLIIWVEDNGSGIPNEVLQRLQYKSSQMKLSKQLEASTRVGLGILNVADRLRIHYGPEFGILICSELNKGTRIKIVIPKYKSPGDDNGLEGTASRRRD